MKKILFIMLPALITGCAGPTPKHFEINKAQIKADTEVKLAIIEGYYGKKNKDEAQNKKDIAEFFNDYHKSTFIDKPQDQTSDMSEIELSSRLPLPEGDGQESAIPCSQKCLDNCDEQCRVECPELWGEMCSDEEDYKPEPHSAYDWGEEEQPEEQSEQPLPEGVRAYASTPGDNNVQTNTVGNGNRILIQGGSAPNSAGTNPIEQAMAQLLLKEVGHLKTGGEIAGQQFREGLKTVGEVASPFAVPVAAAYLGGKAFGALEKGYEAAGGNTSVGGNMSGVSTAENGGSATSNPDQSTTIKTTTTTTH